MLFFLATLNFLFYDTFSYFFVFWCCFFFFCCLPLLLHPFCVFRLCKTGKKGNKNRKFLRIPARSERFFLARPRKIFLLFCTTIPFFYGTVDVHDGYFLFSASAHFSTLFLYSLFLRCFQLSILHDIFVYLTESSFNLTETDLFDNLVKTKR